MRRRKDKSIAARPAKAQVTQSNSIAIAVTKSVRGISNRFGVRRLSPVSSHSKLFLPLGDHHRQMFSHRGIQLLYLPFLFLRVPDITEHQVANR